MASLSLPKFSFFLLLITFFSYSSPCIALTKTKCYITSLYQFGDSIADAGNAIRLSRAALQLPYGETYFNKPTGRFSDGRIIADFLASKLNLPFLNPYLDKSGVSFTQGVNFAVAGATALNSSFWAARNVPAVGFNTPLAAQIEWLKSHLQPTCGTNCKQTLRNSLIVMGEFGGVDHWNAIGANKGNSDQVRQYEPFIIDGIVRGVRDLIQLGAPRILVPGVFPFGCLNGYLTAYPNSSNPNAYDQFGCLKSFNLFAEFHNTELKKALENLQCEFPRVKIVYGDYYGAFRTIFRYAPWFGFNSSTLTSACCVACGQPGAQSCPNPSQYVNWDGLHLTDEAYHRIADIIIKSTFPKFGCYGYGDSGVLSSY